jgi:hypothetical protein
MTGIARGEYVEKILRHLGAWQDPPARPPPGGSGPCTYELCDDVDWTPDYENCLTDDFLRRDEKIDEVW